VDISYTLLEQFPATQGGFPQNNYLGVYYGAERFWVGDAVRLKSMANPSFGTGKEILVVTAIQDMAPSTPVGARCDGTGVIVTGDIYRLVHQSESIPYPAGLPTMVKCDLQAREKFAISDPEEPYCTYTPILNGMQVRLEDVKGRWYPGASLFRICHGYERFRELAQTSSIDPAEWDNTGTRMNEMGIAGSGSTAGWRRFKERHTAFVGSIPEKLSFTPLPAQEQEQLQRMGQVMGELGHHQAGTNAMHGMGQQLDAMTNQTEHIDLTGDDEGMEFLNDQEQDQEEDEFMKRMGEELQTEAFLNDDGDAFYGGL
jgi:hypothetical protein